MQKRLLKISMLIVGLMFVFTAVSWADSGKNRYRKNGSEKRIHAKQYDGRSYNRPAGQRDRHKIKRFNNFNHRKKWVPKHRQYKRNKWIRKHRQHHRNKWIRKHRPLHRKKWLHRHYRHYSDSYYNDDGSYDEFSLAASFSEPGVEFSIGTRRSR
jgi:hypothetical protein